MTSVATPASAKAVTKPGLCGKLAVVGLATPNAMKPYVNAGCVKSVVLWNVARYFVILKKEKFYANRNS